MIILYVGIIRDNIKTLREYKKVLDSDYTKV